MQIRRDTTSSQQQCIQPYRASTGKWPHSHTYCCCNNSLDVSAHYAQLVGCCSHRASTFALHAGYPCRAQLREVEFSSRKCTCRGGQRASEKHVKRSTRVTRQLFVKTAGQLPITVYVSEGMGRGLMVKYDYGPKTASVSTADDWQQNEGSTGIGSDGFTLPLLGGKVPPGTWSASHPPGRRTLCSGLESGLVTPNLVLEVYRRFGGALGLSPRDNLGDGISTYLM
ncbi:hypothetical protein F4859DRAFT_484595 [Xylaria cf. heliscus]|nr:hypothetical protein F4859DRAFT_484595 [Xylaria cf. heliscus]